MTKKVLSLLAAVTLIFSGCAHVQETPDPAEESAPASSPQPASSAPEKEPPQPEESGVYAEYQAQKAMAVEALSRRLSEAKEDMIVYRDFSDSANHFTQRSKIYGYMSDEGMKDLDENWTENTHSGSSCIRCELGTDDDGWGGWMFLTGYLPRGETIPRLNTGESPEEMGYNLTGAKTLQFYARGEDGGELVEFFTAGFGYTGDRPYTAVSKADSAPKCSLGFVRLTTDWTLYEIPLDGMDLSNIACGFGFVCSGNQDGAVSRVFYLDDIRFTGEIAAVQNAPVLLRSYDTETLQLQNTAYTYDNALVAIAFLSEGRKDEAKAILDALVYAMEHDRYAPGKQIRNAYASGDISPVPGWGNAAAMPGWYNMDAQQWYEDVSQVGCNVGNTSYAALALLQYDAVYGSDAYVDAAKTLMDWVIDNCAADCGFIAGYDGWPENGEEIPLTYKSIEHNIDAYAAFKRLYEISGDTKYKDAAGSALQFIQSMYDPEKKLFYTGTTGDGVTTAANNIVLDAQVWNAMALGDAFQLYEACLETVKAMSVEGAYPFCQSNANGGWWAEGTAFTALLLRERGDDTAVKVALDRLCTVQQESGLFLAASVEDLSTGIYLSDGNPWLYGRTPHVAPTAWFVMALNDFNPYDFTQSYSNPTN